MRLVVEHQINGPILDDLAGVHHDDPAADVCHDAKVVRDEQKGHSIAVLELSEEVEELGLDRDVDGARRLVRDQQIRLTTQGDGDRDPLCHSTGKLMWIAGCDHLGAMDPDCREELDRF
jgi:hypothetical protein